MYECLHGRNCESTKMLLKLQNWRFPSHFLKLSASFPRGFAGPIPATGPHVEKRGFTKTWSHTQWVCGSVGLAVFSGSIFLLWLWLLWLSWDAETLREAEHSSGSATAFWFLLLLHVTLWWLSFYLRLCSLPGAAHMMSPMVDFVSEVTLVILMKAKVPHPLDYHAELNNYIYYSCTQNPAR